jgi:CubicO group peptidase (beta-lactamase class C family)
MRQLTIVATVVFAALSSASAASGARDVGAALESLVADGAGSGPLAGAVLAVESGGKTIYAGASGCAQFDAEGGCAVKLRPETKIRVASISKFAAAEAAFALARAGAFDLDRDISDYLGRPFRNPAFPDAKITARMLTAHLSSLRDPEEYWVDAPGSFDGVLDNPALFAAPEKGASRAPGAYFSYANINYGVLAAAMERATNMRFDQIVRARVIEPLGLDAGFNWSGVSPKARRKGATLYRKADGRWSAQTDDAATLAGALPVFRRKDGLDAAAYLAGYKPGENATLFSPQGGLRASALDLLALGTRIRSDPARAAMLWQYDPQTENGATEDGYYGAFGAGVQRVEGNALFFPGATLDGHSGEAFGLYSGMWVLRADPARGRPDDATIAFAITGASAPPGKGVHPSFNVAEEALMRLALGAIETAAHPKEAREPRPFSDKADADRDVEAAFARARLTGRRVLLALGGNWCHDSRALAALFERPEIARLIADRYELVWVDVGMRDKNLHIPRRFGVADIVNTPTLLILSVDGALLNADSVREWRNAANRTPQEAVDYFGRF